MKIHRHHRGLAGMFVAATLLYYFGLTSQQSSAVMLDCNTASSINVPAIECWGLVELYNNMDGPSRGYNTNWNTDTNICSWAGITCTNIAGQDHVTVLALPSNNMSGTLIPKSMSGLSYLTGLNLSDNTLGGMLPAEWSTWTGIEYFNMQGVNVGFLIGTTGTLPSEWSTWENIQYFNVGSNRISSILPTAWSSWTNIQHFSVGGNQLTGELPASWSTWGNIQYFNTSRNSLTGTLPTAWATWTNIKEFNVSTNSIGGTGPWSSWIDRLPSVEIINIAENQFTGELPAIWGNGGVPAGYPLREFYASYNNFTGTLPSDWRTLSALEIIDLSVNKIVGFIPDEWKLLTGMRQFLMSANELQGQPLASLSGWTNLESFRIDSNHFTGTLPSEWSTWTNLTHFRVCYNNLTGTLPASWSAWTQLDYFCARNNQLIGIIPTEWSTWSNITAFYVDENNLTGTLSAGWSTRTDISAFGAKNNDLIGTLPASWSTWTQMRYFDVGNNLLGGNLPTSWSTWTNLVGFAVNNNILTGTLPGSWSAWVGVNNLLLNSNFLEGEVPASWTSMTALTTPLASTIGLHLENNCLEPDLPEPPASFVESKAGTGWESLQDLCAIESDLVITKNNSTLTTGIINGTYTYTIDYINSGAMAVSGVIIRDTLLTGFTYDNATPSATMITGQEISWDIGTLTPMEGGTITLVVSIGNGFFSGDAASNTATIEGTLTDIDTLNNTSTTSPITIIGSPITGDLSLEKTSLNTSATAGDTIAYTLEYSNEQYTSGNAPSAFSISDSLPVELTYVSTDFGSGYDFSTGIVVSGSNITWNFWEVDSQSTGIITVYAQIDGGTSSGTLISNTAFITGTIEDSNWTNNISTANDILVFGAIFTGDLAIIKSSSHTGAYSGDVVTFTIVYTNSGENAVTGISLLDIMSPDLMYLTSSLAPDIVTGDISYTSFYWYLPTGLAAHSSGIITMQAQVMTGTSGGSLRNTIQIESPIPTDIDSDNNISNVSFTFLVASDISGDSFSTPSNDNETRSYAGPGGWDPPRITYHSITGETENTSIVELGAPTLLDNETCIYNDGDFEKFKTTFKDIQNSIFKAAVDTMLDYCLVQGERNQGKMFGVYNYLRWGEAYKIFGRLAGVDFTKKARPTHWSDTYRFAGMKLNLWASTTSQPHDPRSYIRYADIFTIGNNILRYYNKPPLEYDPTLNYNNAISRGKFALFIAQLITTIKQ